MKQSWTSLPVSLVLLRAFLGVTFLYAGAQKLMDPNFLHPGTPDFIGNQLQAFSLGSPIGPLLRLLAHAPTLTGIGIAVSEIGIGVGTLLGIAPLLMAAAGLAINLTLTLSATWHVHPYFLASDSIYAVAWLAYLLGMVEVARRREADRPAKARAQADEALGRRELLRGGLLAGVSVLVALAAAAVAGAPAKAIRAFSRSPEAQPSSGPSVSGTQGPSATGSQAAGSGASSPPGDAIASLDSLAVGDAVGFQDPAVGPCALVRVSQNEVVAYSRVCTHQGCLVGYDTQQRLLFCPCHGAEFDPARGAEVVGGPAPRPLDPVPVAIADGQVVLSS